MRKDVKFGLTIGALLVVTLVVYVIVLSRGPAVPQHISVALPGQSDQSAAGNTDASDTSATNRNTDDTYKPDSATDGTDANAPLTTTNNTPTQTETTPSPATQPAVTAEVPTDWEGALNNGPAAITATPQRTVTPTIIDSNANNVARTGIARTSSTPMIDSLSSLPSTQPSRPLMADIPSLDAAAPTTPPPAIRQYPAPLNATAAVPSPLNTPRTHRVVLGESPYTISQTVYGNGKYFKKIMAANPNIDPRHLKIGQILVIPELTDSDKPASPAASNAPAMIDSKTAYTVASGDTLESISRKLYGTSRMAEQLYEANQKLIGPDENVLKIGWTLKLPEAPTTGSDRQ